MPKTPAAQARENERRRQKSAAAKAAKLLQQAAAPVADATDDIEGELTIEVKVPEPGPRPTLRERFLGGKKHASPVKAPSARKVASKSVAPNMISSVLPVLGASVIATWAKDKFPEEYQPCAPSQEEVTAVIKPLTDILGRRISVAVKLSQDTIDVTNSLLCMMAYSVRAYVMYVDIKKDREASHGSRQTERQTEHLSPAVANEAQAIGAFRPVSGAYPGGSESNGTSGHGADTEDGSRQLRDAEAALVADLLRRDKLGRDKRGLI